METVCESLKVWAYYPNPLRQTQIAKRREFIEAQAATLPAAIACRETIARVYPDLAHSVDSIARGCVLVATEIWCDGSWLQTEMMDVLAYNAFQIRRVDHTGHCDGGCDAEKLTDSNRGPVCRQTWKPCQHSRLAELAELIDLINPKPKRKG